MSNSTMTAMPENLTAVREGAAMVVTLQRPGRRNAIDRAMRRQLAEMYAKAARDPIVYAVVQLSAVDKVFSIGGDIREMLEIATQDPADAARALFDELALCWQHECFSKPTVSLIDGPVMGTGVGISLYGTHRVAGAGYRFQMPETAIGYFPDCGVAHVFAAMPPGVGMYLALTGVGIDRADAYRLGLVTHCIDADAFDAITQHLREADPVDPVLDSRHRDPGPSPLLAMQPRLQTYFEGASLADIVRRLEGAQGGDAAWARETAADLRRKCPLALAITFEAVQRARSLDLRETLIQDWRIAHRLVLEPDLREGVRAVLIDKTRAPAWSPGRVEDLDLSRVGAFFGAAEHGEPTLATRDEIQGYRS